MLTKGVSSLAKKRSRTWIFRLKSFGVLCFIIFFQTILFSLTYQGPTSDRNAKLVSIYNYELDLTPPGKNSFACIQVHSDGRFHMESRLQQRIGSEVQYFTYDAVVDHVRLVQLNKIVEDPTLRALPEFVRPSTPATKYLYREMSADIVTDDNTKKVGYVTWRSHGVESSGSSIETAPENIRRAQLVSEAALAPLAKWFQEIQEMRFEPSNSPRTACQ
jgi:hypothetical protein